jgi:hypothetical protein
MSDPHICLNGTESQEACFGNPESDQWRHALVTQTLDIGEKLVPPHVVVGAGEAFFVLP